MNIRYYVQIGPVPGYDVVRYDADKKIGSKGGRPAGFDGDGDWRYGVDFDTWEEAQPYLVKRHENRVAMAKKELARAFENMMGVKMLKNPSQQSE